jgi:hypothetical protein
MQYWIHAAAGMLAAAFLAAGRPSADQCRVEGTVYNAVTGQPVRKARLTLLPIKGEPQVVSTDAQGNYAFTNVEPGTYQLTAAHDGYVAQHYGAQKEGEDQKGEAIELSPGTVKSAVDLKLTPLGAIMGFVRDEDGDPDGHFAFRSLRPGRYKIYAWESVDINAAMYDTEFRKPFESKGQTVGVEEKQRASVQLQLIPKVE